MVMSFFRRKTTAQVPENVTESWSPQDNAVVLTVPFNGADREAVTAADRLTNTIVQTVNAVQAGHVGDSIPEGTTDAQVKIVVDCGTTSITPLGQQAVDILRERLGKSMPLEVLSAPAPQVDEAAVSLPEIPRTGPDGKKLGLWDSLKAAAEHQAQAQAAASGTTSAPRADLVAPHFTWDTENSALRADIVILGEAGADAQTRTDVAYLVEQTLASLGTPDVQALVPEGTANHEIWLTVAVNDDAAGTLTRRKLDEGEKQFENTRVDFVVMIEPREEIEKMLAVE